MALKFNANVEVLGTFKAKGFDFQIDVLNTQVDATLDPGVSPTTGDRYIITNSAALHANFGTITGVGNGDIVEYDGSNFVVEYDVSVQGEGAKVWDRNANKFANWDGSAWSYEASSSVSALNDLSDVALISPADAHFLIFDNTSGDFENHAISGDISIDKDGLSAIAAGVIVDADVNASAAIAESKLSLDYSTSSLNSAITSNDTDISNLQGALGASTEAAITYSSTNYVTNATDPITAIGALDAQVGANASGISGNDTDISNLQGALGASTEAGITYSSTNYITNGTDLVTAAGALDAQVQTNAAAISALSAAMNFQGSLDASTLGSQLDNAQAGDYWVVTVGGTIFGTNPISLAVGDHLVCTNNVVGTPTDGADFSKVDNTESTDILRNSDLSSAQIFVGNASNVATAVTMSGDATLSNTGALSLGAGVVDTAELAADSVDKTKIAADIAGLGLSQAAGGELDVNVDDSTVEIATDTLRVKDGGITAAKLASGALQRYSALIGGSTAVAVNHALGLTNANACHITMFEVSTGDQVLCDSFTFTDGNNLTVNFAVAPAASAIRINITSAE